MAVESVVYKRYGTNDVELTVIDDGTSMRQRIEIPDPLPPAFATKKEYVKAQAKRMVIVIRNRRQDRIDRATQWDEASVTNQSADAAEFLTELQSELP